MPMAEGSQFKSFLNNIASSAIFEMLRNSLGGSLVTSLCAAIWEYLRHRSVDWWGIFALFVLTFAVLLWGKRRRMLPAEVVEIPPAPPPIHAQDGLLSPLQVDILVLSRGLRAFLQKIGPAPELRNPGPIKAGEDLATEMAKRTADVNAWHVAYGEWARKRLYGYQAHYLEGVKKVANEIGAESGIVVAPLMRYIADVKPNIDFDALPDLLLEFLIELEKPEEARRLEAERKMQEKQALLTDKSNGFARIEGPQGLKYRAVAVMGGLYAFLIEKGYDPCGLRDDSYAGLDSGPEGTRIKDAFPERFRDHLSIIEDGADRYGFWEAVSFSFANSRERVSTLHGDVNSANGVRSVINTLSDLVRAIDSKHQRKDSQ